MAKYPAMTTTNAGLNVIGEANTTGVAVIFTKIVAGDGDVPEGTGIADLTSVISPHLEIATMHGENLGNGQYQLKGTLDNSTLETGFRAKEIGVYAKAGEDGEENLFAYTNGGNYTDYIPDKRTPIDAQDFYIDIVVGNANEVEIIVSDENYVTREDVDILIGDHDAKYESHRDVYGKFIRQKSTAYSVGDVVYLPNLGAKLYLECTAGGTTDSSYLTITSPVVNMLVTDGTVTWTICRIGSGDGEAVGVIKQFAGNGNIPSGYLLCDGSAVSRTMFPDLFAAIGTTYGSGDGSTTFNLPDYNTAQRFAQGGTVAGTVKQAGLPNITGTFNVNNYGVSGAFTKDTYQNFNDRGTTTTRIDTVTLDASASNPIYGNSDTVQPNALTCRYIIKAFDGQTADSALIDITQYAEAVADARVPIGMMLPCATETARKNFLLCDGSAVSRDTYSALFAVIGTKYGVGDGSTTFNLPNYNVSGRFVQGGTVAGTVKQAGLPNITGTLSAFYSATRAQAGTGCLSTTTSSASAAINAGSGYVGITINASQSNSIYGKSTTVQPPALTACWQIKYC